MELSYYRSFEERRLQRLAFLKLRNYNHEILDCKASGLNSVAEEIRYIQNHGPDILLSYNIIKRTTFLYELVRLGKRLVVMEFLDTLEVSSKKDCGPFLFPEVFHDGKLDTAFDRVFDLPQPREIVMRMLKLMLEQDKDGRLYQDIIERNLQRMIKINVDFTQYLESSMVRFEIPHSEEWPQFHPKEDELFIGVNFD